MADDRNNWPAREVRFEVCGVAEWKGHSGVDSPHVASSNETTAMSDSPKVKERGPGALVESLAGGNIGSPRESDLSIILEVARRSDARCDCKPSKE